jgi:hypothetical protein
MIDFENISEEEVLELSDEDLSKYSDFIKEKKDALQMQYDPLYLREEEQQSLDSTMRNKVDSGELNLENGFLNTELYDSIKAEEIQKIISNRNSNEEIENGTSN